MRLVFDIEANGLYDEADKIWCICAKDIDTGETKELVLDNSSTLTTKQKNKQNRENRNRIELFFNGIYEKDICIEYIGHNIINYDLPLLKKIFNWTPNEHSKITDTLVMSRLANPDRPKPSGYTGKGRSHSLEAWGYRIGKGKPDHEDWSVFSSDMLRRCRQDVEINYLVDHSVSRELEDFSDESIQLEHEIAKIITKQEHYGIKFNTKRAKEFIGELSEWIENIDKELIPKLPKELEIIGTTVSNPFKVNGKYRKQTLDYLEKAYAEIYSKPTLSRLIGGPYTRIKFNEFNIGSVQKIKEYLLGNGWEPEFWNTSKETGERTSPKLEGAFRGVVGDLPKRIKHRISLLKRKSIIKGWLENLRDDDTLPAGANTNGAITGRMLHTTVVNVPRANVDKETGNLIWDIEKQKDIYGTQMRSLFIPREGYKLVGHDASGLELRMLAHYLNDEEFTKQILFGDIHTFNQERAGLPTRDAAKTFIYALIYGAGDRKIGSLVEGDERDGKDIKERYFQDVPTLSRFIDKVKRAAGKGWLRGLDGRRLYMRRDRNGRIDRKKAVNTLLQAAGAIIMKRSCTILWDDVKHAQIDAHKVLDMHDEGQSEVLNDSYHIKKYSELAEQSIIKAGEFYNLNIPLAADVKIGNNWAETH